MLHGTAMRGRIDYELSAGEAMKPLHKVEHVIIWVLMSLPVLALIVGFLKYDLIRVLR